MRGKFLFLIMIGLFKNLYGNDSQNYSIVNGEIKNKISEYKEEFYFKKASLFFVNKQWDSTLIYSSKQLVKNRYPELFNYCHYYRGISFQKKKIFEEAKKELKLITKDFIFHSDVILALGEVALEQSDYNKAVKYFKKIENLSGGRNYDFKKSKVIHNLGICYLHLNEFNQAESYLLESVRLYKGEKDDLMLVGTYGDLATLYYVQYKDKKAIPYFKKGYELSKEINDFNLKFTTAHNMAVVEENRKNYIKALAYRKEFEQWKDSLNDQNKVWEVAKLEKEFAVKQKQKEVSLLQAENKIKIAERNGLFYSAIVLLLLLGTGAYFLREKVKTNKIITSQKEKLDVLNATKDKLFSIVSHDLRSSVNALKSSHSKLVTNLKAKNLEQLDTLLHNNSAIVNGAYGLLDNLLHWALLQTKQGYFEMTEMRLFFIVEQIAFNYQAIMADKNIVFENTVAKKEMVYADQESLKIILRNLLDNAIKFTESGGAIKIYVQSSEEEYCHLVIEDSGLGMDENTRLQLVSDTELLSKKKNEDIIGTGLGLQLCKSMIAKNGGKFNIESELAKGSKMLVSLKRKA